MSILFLEPTNKTDEAIFASHNLHEITMYYPMRAIRTHRYKLIHNINYNSPFPIDQDFYLSPTFQVILHLAAIYNQQSLYQNTNLFFRIFLNVPETVNHLIGIKP